MTVVAPANAAVPSPRQRWLRVDTPSFTVLGDVSPRRLSEIAEEVELFRAALGRLKPEAARPSPVPTLVLAFDGERHFAPYRALPQKSTRELVGVFHGSPWGNSIAFDAGRSEDEALAIVLHEYVHFFVSTVYPSTPLWLNEGLAEYYSSFQDSESRVEIGRAIARHVLSLREGWRMPLARLLAVDHDSPEYLESERAGAFYAQSWALVHYMLVGEPQLAARMPELLARLDRGESAESAARGALGLSLADLEDRLRRYVGRTIFQHVRYPMADLVVPVLAAPAEISHEEALTLLAEHLAHAGDLAGATEHLAALSGPAATSGDALALSGFLAEQGGRRDEAGALFGRAAAAAPRRASSWLHIARHLLERGESAAARRAAEAALALAPDFGEAWATLGYVALRERDAVAAIVAFAEAERRLPARGDLVFNRFLACLEAGQTTVARALIDGKIARLEGAERAAEARKLLESRLATERLNAAIEEANRAFAADDPDAAAAALRRSREGVTDPELLGVLDERLAEAERIATSHHQVDAYNRAVGLFNSGKLAEARQILVELAAGCGVEPVCEAARELTTKIDRLLRRKR